MIRKLLCGRGAHWYTRWVDLNQDDPQWLGTSGLTLRVTQHRECRLCGRTEQRTDTHLMSLGGLSEHFYGEPYEVGEEL